MSKKHKKKKHKVVNPVMYYASSNIDKKTWKRLCAMAHEGFIIYIQSGKPTNPPGCPPGGCN